MNRSLKLAALVSALATVSALTACGSPASSTPSDDSTGTKSGTSTPDAGASAPSTSGDDDDAGSATTPTSTGSTGDDSGVLGTIEGALGSLLDGGSSWSSYFSDGGISFSAGPSADCQATDSTGKVVLGPESTSQTVCTDLCTTATAVNSSLTCQWNGTTVMASGACTILDASSSTPSDLYGPAVDTQADCTSQCTTFSKTNPFLTCNFNGTDITPKDMCSITGPLDISVFGPQSLTASECLIACDVYSSAATVTCTYGSTDITSHVTKAP